LNDPGTENRTGKTFFLRLLLDTSAISLRASKDQLASVARFVQGRNGHTSHIWAVSIDITLDVDLLWLICFLAQTGDCHVHLYAFFLFPMLENV